MKYSFLDDSSVLLDMRNELIKIRQIAIAWASVF